MVFEANDRCDQENLIAQLAGAQGPCRCRSIICIPNWAYMVATALAWNLKAWWALWLPEEGRWCEKHAAEKNEILRMEFRTFLNAFIRFPARSSSLVGNWSTACSITTRTCRCSSAWPVFALPRDAATEAGVRTLRSAATPYRTAVQASSEMTKTTIRPKAPTPTRRRARSARRPRHKTRSKLTLRLSLFKD